MSYQAVIANAYYGDDGKVIQMVPINRLEKEAIKINGATGNVSSQNSVYHESLYSVVLSQILKPKDWKPNPDNSFPIAKNIIIKICDEVTRVL